MEPRPRAAAPPSSAPVILLVEDNEDSRVTWAQILEGAGYRVLPAANGAEALDLALAPENRVALMITDVVLPDWSGIEMAVELRTLRPRIPVLYVSGYVQKDRWREIIGVDDSRLLEKPIRPPELLKVVAELLQSTGRQSA